MIPVQNEPLLPAHRKDPPPRRDYFTMEVTTRCNNTRCNYCFALAALERLDHMDPRIAFSALEEAFALGYRMLHITGGEPTLWPPLNSLVDRAAALGFRHILVNTNAMHLNQRTRDLLGRHRELVEFTVTLNGPPRIHEASRGRGSYGPTMRGIQQLVRAGSGVRVFTVVTRSLLPHLPGFVQELFGRFPEIRSQVLIQLHRTAEDSSALPLLDESSFTELVQMAGFLRAYCFPLYFLDNPLTETMARVMGMPPLPSFSLLREGRLTLLRDGRLTGAHSSRESFGTYGPGLLRETLLSDSYRRSFLEDRIHCSPCPHREECRLTGMTRPTERNRDCAPPHAGEHPFCRRVLDALDASLTGRDRSGSKRKREESEPPENEREGAVALLREREEKRAKVTP